MFTGGVGVVVGGVTVTGGVTGGVTGAEWLWMPPGWLFSITKYGVPEPGSAAAPAPAGAVVVPGVVGAVPAAAAWEALCRE